MRKIIFWSMVKFTIKNPNPSGLEMTKELGALFEVAENAALVSTKKHQEAHNCL